MPRGALLALFVAISTLLLGCGRSAESVQPIRAWTLHVAGTTRDAPVELPAHLDASLPSAPARYTLSTRVSLDDDLRGRDLVFAIPSLQAIASLRVDGVLVDALETSELDVYRSRGPHAWRIRRELVGARARDVLLVLEVDHTWPMSGWIEGTPRLSATPAGDAPFRRVVAALDAGNALALGTLWSAGFTYLVLFVLSPVRRYHGWFALQALCAAHYPLFLTGWTQAAGTWDTTLLAVSQPWAALAGLRFTYATFKLGRAPAWPTVAAAVASVLGFAVRDRFVQLRVLAPITCAVCVGIVVLHLGLLARVARRPAQRAIACTLAVSWVFVFAALAIDGGAFVGLGEYLGGFRIGAWALALVAMAQSAALGREHAESLRNADALNAALAHRVSEVEELNVELRRRIGERSREVQRSLVRAVSRITPGEILAGRYRLERLVGVGGMGRVYEVTSLRDGRRLALKAVGKAEGEDALARFAREAELAVRVVHPNVVSVVDFDVGDDGLPFLVMDLVVGEALEAHRARFGDVPWALGVLAQIAAGLEAVHDRGIVHRDLKPSNVLLTTADPPRARITDFGISRAVPAFDEEATAPVGARAPLTETGLVLGTPAYMAPELAFGARDATPVADVFALAVVAFELLTGRRPFVEPAILAAQRGERAHPVGRIGAFATGVPDGLAQLIDRALDGDPPVRPSAGAFARALENALQRAA